ncbi:hypothetical protein [Methanolobus sp. WCC5]|uniref:hypothetical protein n=1 Tax=Methanolobus sp. WCC5 TaxID=3125785 RepID=UPI0032515651
MWECRSGVWSGRNDRLSGGPLVGLLGFGACSLVDLVTMQPPRRMRRVPSSIYVDLAEMRMVY